MTDERMLERIAGRRAELDLADEGLVKHLADMRVERNELVVAEPVVQRISEIGFGEYLPLAPAPPEALRYYSAEDAAYLSPDPVGLAADVNNHRYVPNPLAWIDPLGLCPIDPATHVAMDAGTARALASDDQTVAQDIARRVGSRILVMPKTAADEFAGAVDRLRPQGWVSDTELARAKSIMENVRVIADDPSERASGLKVTKKVGENDKVIFGTADKLGLSIFTGDAKFLAGAKAQGVEFNAEVHPTQSFKGKNGAS